jgi:pSer/pThr/pTyr-binding forkhead associated (FHA) protein
MMKLCLAMEIAGGSERCFPIDRSPLVLGRDTRCDLRLAVPSVSARHCEIVEDANTLYIKDLGSETGTYHNGVRVEKAGLAANDRLTIGPVTFVIKPLRAADPAAAVAELKPGLRSLARPARPQTAAKMSTEGLPSESAGSGSGSL